jgi:hypothetical protein
LIHYNAYVCKEIWRAVAKVWSHELFPNETIPNVKIPNVKIPNVKIPNVKIPNVKIPIWAPLTCKNPELVLGFFPLT